MWTCTNNWPRASTRRRRSRKDFYDEYFAVLDLAAEFYLETVSKVFQEYALPRGRLEWQGSKIEPRRSAAPRS